MVEAIVPLDFPNRSSITPVKDDPEKIIIRNAQPADFPDVAAILNENLDVIWRTEPYSVEDIAQKFLKATEFLVATDETGLVIGFISSTQAHPDGGFKKATQALSIYVTRKRNSRGVGTALLSTLIARLRSQGFRVLKANVDAENSRSFTWHKRRGFNWSGFEAAVGDKGGDPRDLVVLTRRIDQVCGSCGEPI